MSAEFSETSRLIIQNWDILKEIRKAEVELAVCLREFLFDFKSRLTQCKWWDDQWYFKRERDTQVYIAHNEWKRGNGHAIWIGIENFTAEALFGTDSFASLYVWVSGNRLQLVSALRKSLEDESDIVRDVQIRGSSGYVLKKPLRKCLPEELDHFDEVVAAPMIDFFSCYGQRAEAFSTILNAVEKTEIQQARPDDK